MFGLELTCVILYIIIETVFPVLDVFRIAVKHSSVSNHFYSPTDGVVLVKHICGLITHSAPIPCVVTGLRILTNSFLQPSGLSLMLQEMDIILTAMNSCINLQNRNVQVAMCTVLLNYAVAVKNTDDMEAKSHILNVVSALTHMTLDGEAVFRLLVCLGTLVSSNESSIAIAVSLDLQLFVQKHAVSKEPTKVSNCSKYLVPILKY